MHQRCDSGRCRGYRTVMPAFVGWIVRSRVLEEARSAFGRIVNEGHRAAQIITSIRAMFKKDSGARSPVAS